MKNRRIIIPVISIIFIFLFGSTFSYAGNALSNGWGVASWYCEKASSDIQIDEDALSLELIGKCNKMWNLDSVDQWTTDQYEQYSSMFEEAIKTTLDDYNKKNIKYNVAVAFSMPEDQNYLKDYIKNCRPYVYFVKDGKTCSRTPIILTEGDNEYAYAFVTLSGYGNYEGMICHNDKDGIPTAQNEKYDTLSTISISVYDNGIKCQYANKMNEDLINRIKSISNNKEYINGYKDVNSNSWYYDSVMDTSEKNLLKGNDGYFYPEKNLSYAEAITIAARINAMFNNENPETVFQNNLSPWYTSYLNYSENHGIPCSYENYNDTVTREEFVHILYYSVPKEYYKDEVKLIEIPDISAESPYCDEIYTLYKSGIISGSDENGNFLPQNKIRRCEASSIISKLLKELN